MAIKPSDEYPGQTVADAAYPQGKARNQLVPGDGVGTPLEQKWVNDLWGFMQALLDEAGLTPSGDPDEVGASQYLEAIEAIAASLDAELENLIDASADLDPKPSRSRIYHGSVFRPFIQTGSTDLWRAAVASAGTGWRPQMPDNFQMAMVPLNELLPFGAELTRADLMIVAGTHTSGGRFSLHSVQLDFEITAVSAHAETAAVITSGTGLQVRSLTGSPIITVGTSASQYLVYNPTDLTAGADTIEGLRLVFNDPGPRNF